VFVISCFDSSIAARCPEQILTVGESRGGDSSKGEPKGEAVADTVTESVGTGSWWNGKDIADTITGTNNEQRMPDKNKLQMVVVEQPIIFSHTQGLDAQPSEIYSPTLRTEGAGMAVAIPMEERTTVGALQARDYKGVGNQYVMENKLVVQQTPPSAK
jgi:hypothetical protein